MQALSWAHLISAGSLISDPHQVKSLALKSAHFKCNSFPQEEILIWHYIFGICLTSLKSRTRGQMFSVALYVQWSFLFWWRQNAFCIATSGSCREQNQSSCSEWVGSIETFKHKLQEGILAYIKYIINSPCVLESLIEASNHIFVSLVFREWRLNGGSSWNKYVS